MFLKSKRKVHKNHFSTLILQFFTLYQTKSHQSKSVEFEPWPRRLVPLKELIYILILIFLQVLHKNNTPIAPRPARLVFPVPEREILTLVFPTVSVPQAVLDRLIDFPAVDRNELAEELQGDHRNAAHAKSDHGNVGQNDL